MATSSCREARASHLLTMVMVLAIGWRAMPQTARAQTQPSLRGTFLQFRADEHWTEAKLRDLFLDVQRLGISRIVVQWAVAGTKAFYPSGSFESLPEPPLEPLLKMADESGMRVRVGLAYDPEFWNKTTLRSQTRDVETYLQMSRKRSVRVAEELLPRVGQHRSFEGWFLTEEVDDVNWLVPERRALLHSYLGDLGRTLHMLGSPANVAVSGFSNAHADPSTLEAFWSELLSETSIDLVFFQDGVGAHKLELPYLGLYLGALKRATLGSGSSLSVVAELFDQVEGPPVTDRPFKAVPAHVDRLAQQLKAASEASTAGIFAFSVPDYMVPRAGPEAERLYNDYMKRFRTPPESR